MAYDICNSTYLKYDKIVLYFMSDGVSKFPEKAIDRFKNDRTFIEMINFYAIGFGKRADSNLL